MQIIIPALQDRKAYAILVRPLASSLIAEILGKVRSLDAQFDCVRKVDSPSDVY